MPGLRGPLPRTADTCTSTGSEPLLELLLHGSQSSRGFPMAGAQARVTSYLLCCSVSLTLPISLFSGSLTTSQLLFSSGLDLCLIISLSLLHDRSPAPAEEPPGPRERKYPTCRDANIEWGLVGLLRRRKSALEKPYHHQILCGTGATSAGPIITDERVVSPLSWVGVPCENISTSTERALFLVLVMGFP